MYKPKTIITPEMLANMEMFAVTHPGMRDLLEQCKVLYTLSGSPTFFDEDLDGEDDIDEDEVTEEYDDIDWNKNDFDDVKVTTVYVDELDKVSEDILDAKEYFRKMWRKT